MKFLLSETSAHSQPVYLCSQHKPSLIYMDVTASTQPYNFTVDEYS
jgi:hypothetical protein